MIMRYEKKKVLASARLLTQTSDSISNISTIAEKKQI